MGLDMYFYSVCPFCGEKKEIHYYRKHSDLNGWLLDKYLERNSSKTRDDFNLCEFELDKPLIDALKEYCNKEEKEEYAGFFWGESRGEDWEDTKNVLIPKLEECLSKNHKIVYHPWW